MSEMDKDLLSVQEARQMVLKAREAQQVWATANQEQVDRVCAAMADRAFQAAER
jgi:acetaldehyde dehydrogenase (acetylating)